MQSRWDSNPCLKSFIEFILKSFGEIRGSFCVGMAGEQDAWDYERFAPRDTSLEQSVLTIPALSCINYEAGLVVWLCRRKADGGGTERMKEMKM